MTAFAHYPRPLALAAGLALAVAAAPVAAAGTEGRSTSAGASSTGTSVAQLNEEGASLYAARDYRRAIEKFIQAYAIDNDPNLLFNIARCYEELGEVDAAIEKYETFLKTPGADTRGRQRARDSLAALKQMRDTRDTDATVSGSASVSSTAERDDSGAAPPAAASEGSSAWPWVTLGGSVLFAAAGATFYVLGASDHGQVTDAPGYGDPQAISTLTRREADDLVSSGDTKKLIGGVSLGLAGALAATYVVLLVTDDDTSAQEQDVAFSIAPSRGGASLSVQGSF